MWRAVLLHRARSHYSQPSSLWAAMLVGSTATVTAISWTRTTNCEQTATSAEPEGVSKSRSKKPRRQQLLSFTADQVAQRNGRGDHAETWITYKDKVYDITTFIKEHPGGDMIRDAAGGPIENYWAYWAYHTALARPIDTLQQYEIGSLIVKEEDNDNDEDKDNHDDDDDDDVEEAMYSQDPDRNVSKSHGQRELLKRPWNSETSPEKLQTFYTPVESFYVRNHAPVPDLQEEDDDSSENYNLSIQLVLPEDDDFKKDTDKNNNSSSLDLDLRTLQQRYPTVTITSVLQCAGNRASDMIQVAPTAFSTTPFRHIQTGMMGNATWTGVKLRQVLMDKFPQLGHFQFADTHGDTEYHVEFQGVDQYSTSVPLKRIMDPTADVLLAWECNGQPLTRDHGYPLRVFLPGIAGARSVKWLHSIIIQPKESTSCFSQTYYKDVHGQSIQELPMQCFLTEKQVVVVVEDKSSSSGAAAAAAAHDDDNNSNNNHAATAKEVITVKGIAWGGGSGVGIASVQVSADQGKTWQTAKLVEPRRRKDASSRNWSWVLFEATLTSTCTLPICTTTEGEEERPTVICRAIDKKGRMQPEKSWNPKGYLSNSWHKL
jgi:sulfite oxidase